MKSVLKLALIVSSFLVSGAAIAQTVTANAGTPATAVLPTAPNPPAIVATSPNETEAGAVATTNKVYIDQNGNNVNINIQQTGVSNIVGTMVNPIYMHGDNQTFTTIQTGNSNSILMGIIGSTGGTAAGTLTTIQQIGNGNSAVIACGTGQGESNCNNLNINDVFTGNNNSLNFHGAAANITQTINANGNSNSITANVTSPNASQTLLLTGNNNTLNVTQTDAGGTYGHSLYANFTGTGNTVTTQQYGASETVINITSTGNNGTFNIKTGH